MPYFDPVDAQVEGGAQALGEVWALALAWKTYQVRTQSFEVTSQIISQVIIDMSLSNRDIENLKARLTNNRNLLPTYKQNLNTFINNKKSVFDRSTFMQQYNAKMKNYKNKTRNFLQKERTGGGRPNGRNNSAMQANRNTESIGSVNKPGGVMSPRGPLSGALSNALSGASNNGIVKSNANSRPTNAAARAKAAANAKAATNKAAANKARANANARAAANKARANANKARANANTKAAANKAAANAKKAFNNKKNTITSEIQKYKFKNLETFVQLIKKAKNDTGLNEVLTRLKRRNRELRGGAAPNNSPKINNNKNIINLINLKDILEFKLTKTQLIEIAKSVGKNPTNKDTVPKLANMIMANNKNIEKVKNKLNRDTEFTQITQKVNEYSSSIQNTNRTRPKYTASLVSLFIKDLPIAVRTKILSDNHSKLPEIMKGINQRCIPSTPIKIEKKISRDEFTDLVFIMWLDGVHDKYIKKTLNTWFNETTLFSNTQKTLIVKDWNTPFIQNINSLGLTKARGPKILTSSLNNFPAQWEKKIKIYLSETKYKNSATKYKFQTRIPKRVSTPNPQNINIAIDQEYDDSNEQSITRFIKNHTRANNSTTDVNTLITYGQAFDPGRSMVGGGVHEDIEMLTQNQIPKNYISDTKKYYLCDLNINFIVDNIPVYKIRLKKDDSNNVNMSFNSKKIFGGVTAAQAKSAKGDIIPVSKYFGDALQYFYIAAMNDVQRTESPKTERFFFGSGDSMALLGYDRVCKILNNSVRMVIDIPSKNDPVIHVIGLDATITNRPQPAASGMTGTGRKNNNSGEVISGSRARANANANANARARARAAANKAAKAKRQERELKQLGVSPTQGPRTRARSN
jgi:hypothetical protein